MTPSLEYFFESRNRTKSCAIREENIIVSKSCFFVKVKLNPFLSLKRMDWKKVI
ncbi:hypothetical protein ADICYQ_2127 [Cyclobacterium qasimii M12-11B]|uniref:Uncharacterized protein n=1 Tax=Cyclobacterium qasimii M12-11B TaxID=641524 RepID=S7VFH9_9BACT|nr:hypothetical protein ADICYQ_2127 [Cyclobacterium qasimii M12-11B]